MENRLIQQEHPIMVAGIQDWVSYHGYDKLMIKAWSDVGIPSKYFALLKAQVNP